MLGGLLIGIDKGVEHRRAQEARLAMLAANPRARCAATWPSNYTSSQKPVRSNTAVMSSVNNYKRRRFQSWSELQATDPSMEYDHGYVYEVG